MWVIVVVLGAWCLGVLADPEPSVMGRLYWCNTLCMCNTETNEEVKCFSRNALYELVGITRRQATRLDMNNWFLEERLDWCNDRCLCHKHNEREFQCAEKKDLITFIIRHIGDSYFIREIDEEVEEQPSEPEPEPEPEPEHNKRSERRRNRKNRKQRKRERQEEAAGEVEESEAPVVVEPQPEPEPEPEAEAEAESEPTPYQAPEPTTTTAPPRSVHKEEEELEEKEAHEEEVELEEEVEEEEVPEDRGEPLPKQEAVAASPAVTALQPPTRRQPFPTTVESYTPRPPPREVEIIPPRVQPVLEVPKEKKTVASKVSQDLDELGSTVLEIKSDVVLNQRILLVTVAIAGIAMLGVLVLAIHGCSSRRQPPHDHSKKRDAAKEDNHVTKLNMEEAW